MVLPIHMCSIYNLFGVKGTSCENHTGLLRDDVSAWHIIMMSVCDLRGLDIYLDR